MACSSGFSSFELSEKFPNDLDFADRDKICSILKDVFTFVSTCRSVILSKQQRLRMRDMGHFLFKKSAAKERIMDATTHAKMRAMSCEFFSLSVPDGSLSSSDASSLDSISTETLDLLTRSHGRTAKAFYDAKALDTSNQYLDKALRFWHALETRDIAVPINDVGFMLHNWKGRLSWDTNLPENAYSFLKVAGSFLSDAKVQHEAHDFSRTTYNYGVEMYNQSRYDDATQWLLLSSSAVDMNHVQAPKKQSRTLRVLALSYLNQNKFEDALSAIEKSIKFFLDADGLFIRTKCLAFQKKIMETKLSLTALMTRNDCTIEMALDTVETIGEGSLDLAKTGVEALIKRFPHEETQLIATTHLKLLIGHSRFEDAGQLLDSLKQANNEILLHIWTLAISHFERSNFEEAYQWLARCVRFVDPQADSENYCKLILACSQCKFQLKDYAKSLSLALDAEKVKSSDVSSFHQLRALIQMQDNERAQELIRRLKDESKLSSDILCLLAEESKEQPEVCEQVLCWLLQLLTAQKAMPPGTLTSESYLASEKEKNADCSSAMHRDRDDNACPPSLLQYTSALSLPIYTILNALIHLKAEQVGKTVLLNAAKDENRGLHDLIRYLKKAIEEIKESKAAETSESAMDENDIIGLAERAWETALRTYDVHLYAEALDCFLVTNEVINLFANPVKHVSWAQTSLLLTARCYVELATGTAVDKAMSKCFAESSLQVLEKCKNVGSVILKPGDEDDLFDFVNQVGLVEFSAKLVLLDDTGMIQDINDTQKNDLYSIEALELFLAEAYKKGRTALCVGMVELILASIFRQNHGNTSANSPLPQSLLSARLVLKHFRRLIFLQNQQPDTVLPTFDRIIKYVEGFISSHPALNFGDYIERADADFVWISSWNIGARFEKVGKTREAEQFLSRGMQLQKLFFSKDKSNDGEVEAALSKQYAAVLRQLKAERR